MVLTFGDAERLASEIFYFSPFFSLHVKVILVFFSRRDIIRRKIYFWIS